VSEQTSTSTTVATTADQPNALRRFMSGSTGRNLGLIIALLLIIAVGWITAGEQFMNVDNFLTIIRYGSILGVIAIGMTFVITAGGIDLSVGSVMGLASVIASLSWIQTAATEWSWLLMVVVAILVGGLAGLLNGLVIAYGRVVPFITTLAMLVAARGLAEILSNRYTQVVSVRGFLDFFRSDFIGIPWLIWIFVLAAVGGWFLLARTTYGRRTVAIGGNHEASRLAGLKVKRHTVSLYVLSGLAAGVAGVMILARTTAGTSTHGQLYELDAIAAVVVGGTLLVGGRGTIIGTVLGVLIFSTLSNVFTQNNLNISVQAVVKGIIIVVAVMLQQRFAKGSSRSTT
jgi:ribose transport system permease protein